MKNLVNVSAVFLLFASTAWAERGFRVVSESSLRYKGVHRLHAFVGVCRSVDGAGRLLDDGTLQVMARAPVACFDSGNANRDAHMKEAVEAARFPDVRFKGISKKVRWPTAFPARVQVPLEGELTFHGVTRPLSTTVTVTVVNPDQLHTTGRFVIRLDAFDIERPALLFVKIENEMEIELDLKLRLKT